SLANYGLSLEDKPEFEQAEQAEKIQQLFAQATALLGKLGRVHQSEAKFFLTDGTEVSGTVVQLGNIAAYGVSDKGSGLLVPAGAGRFKLWSIPAAATANALLAGNAPEKLQIFLFESKDKPIDEKKEKTAFSVVNSGGEIGWIIVGLGGLAAILVLLRIVILVLASKKTRSLGEEVHGLVERGQDTEAIAYCEQQSGPFARVLKTVINNSEHHHDHMDDVISEALLHEFGALNRYGSAILVIASISPLLGLLGTVTGMISTFDIITEFGTGDPKMLSGGISIALVTTQLGLIIAIPTVLAGTLLGSWAESIKFDLEEAALKVSNILLERSGAALAVSAGVKPVNPNTAQKSDVNQQAELAPELAG
ncbi:MAG: MotA/TolQ/ExbB proton channel family protein, partial [Methylococcales bacterium]|nr:MotA/TolQ/ExbB proton channel family protein [Methylococcales bacterium]